MPGNFCDTDSVSPRPPQGRLPRFVTVLVLLTAGCTNLGSEASISDTASPTPGSETAIPRSTVPRSTVPRSTVPPTTVLPSVDLDLLPAFGQVTVERAEVGTEIVVLANDAVVQRADVAPNGSAVLRDLPTGSLAVQVWTNDVPTARADNIAVPDRQPPQQSFYDQQDLDVGFTYVTMRDGTTLSAHVSLPGSAAAGPYPTLVEYSGYALSNPDAEDPARSLLPALGYAIVQVNVRGTGCSGGSFDAFEPIQGLDGYDTIEAIAAQPWSAKVGMFGISYPGIMQLYVAATNPPNLAAIAPLSVIGDVESVLYPGGIYNNGFGENWTSQVSERAAAFGQDWSRARVDFGDRVCGANQALRVHNPDLVATVQASPFRSQLTDARDPDVSTIDVPVFLAGAWQDEQTGGRFPSLIPQFEQSPLVRANLYNGLHIDPLGPTLLSALVEFYDLYVGERTDTLDDFTRVLVSLGLSSVFGNSMPVPPTRFEGVAPAEARERYEAEPPIRVFFEQGARWPNLPVPNFEASFDHWPPKEIEPLRLFLTDAGRLRDSSPLGGGVRSFTTNPADGALVTTDDLAQIWTNSPDWQWLASEEAASFTSDEFQDEVVMVGPASADLFVRLDTTDADLEVTLSEIGPDGSETYIQVGWLRVSRRALSPNATDLRPIPSNSEADADLVQPGEIVAARVEILPFAHVLRPGSRLRVTVDTPGGSRPQWRFAVLPQPATVEILTGDDHPSSLLLPEVLGIDPPRLRPPCGSLRGQPCRP
ncbi:MAG: putative acyl esterase [Acidimicrobiales bacterium]|jgi:predicted acyl esterase